MAAPLLLELFYGSGGWGQGWLALGGRAIGVDIEHCEYHGPVPLGAELILQDVRTLHGAQFKDAALILASPPCQEFSYRAMPWKRAKALGPPVLGIDLFWQCWRIQHEACEAAGRYIPMVVENVCGAQRWIGQARWHFGAMYLWGDIPPLMPTGTHRKLKGNNSARMWSERRVARLCDAATDAFYRKGSSSMRRKAASAAIARIPDALSQHIARVYWPEGTLTRASESETLLHA